MSDTENEGRRAARSQRLTSVFFENGSDGNSRSIRSAWNSGRARREARSGSVRIPVSTSELRRLTHSLPVTGTTDTSGQLLDSTADGHPDGRLFAHFRGPASTRP